MIYDNFLKNVTKGRKGLNRGIPMGLPRLDKYLRGIQKRKYYLCGANTGIGKTAFIDEVFIMNPYNWIVKNKAKEKLKVFYFSFEIDIQSKLAKWVSYQIFQDHKIMIDPEHILGMDMVDENDEINKLSDKEYELVKFYKEHFEKLFDNIQFEDVPINPTGIYHQVKAFFDSNGHFEIETKTIEGKEKKIKVYIPDDPNLYVEIIYDHLGLTKSEKGYNKKQTIDKLDEYSIELRNTYGAIIIAVSQFNRDLADISRQRFKQLVPLLEDFKDSGNTQESANVVIALFSPKRYNIEIYQEYNLKGIGDFFRMLFVLKNRGGKDGVVLALRFLGHCGYFEEIPEVVEFANRPFLYNKIPDFSKTFEELMKE